MMRACAPHVGSTDGLVLASMVMAQAFSKTTRHARLTALPVSKSPLPGSGERALQGIRYEYQHGIDDVLDHAVRLQNVCDH